MSPVRPESPEFFTIEEAARILRVGRTAAYEQARRWRATEGKEGLPVVAFGRLLRVPRSALEELSGGPVSLSATAELPQPVPARPEVAAAGRPSAVPHKQKRRHARPRSVSADQTQLPFT
jgi:hypothetical protein